MRKGDNLKGMRYCGLSDKYAPYKRGMNWHGTELGRTGRMYRCQCMPMFRLPDSLGPHGFPRRKAWRNRPENRSMKRYDIGKYLPGFN